MIGSNYNEFLAKIQFFVLFIGVNLTFFPFHFLGLAGMPRRYADYPDNYLFWNKLASFGSILSFVAILLFIYIIYLQFTNPNNILNDQNQSGYLNLWVSFPFYFKYFDILFNKYTSSLEFTTNTPPSISYFYSFTCFLIYYYFFFSIYL